MTTGRDVTDHRAHVLIVDNDLHNRQLLEVMLAPEGLFIAAASSGEEALAVVAQHPPDLIVLDVMMPGMNGFQIAARIKSDLATRNIPIIMVTALDDRESRMVGLGAGAEDFLTKPVDRAELCVRVRNLLRLKAYADYHDRYSQMLEDEVHARTADLAARTTTLERQADVLTEQAALLDLAQDAIIVRDMDHRILFWSHGAEVIYGWSSHEALGKNKRELLKSEFPEPTEEMDAALLCVGRWEGEAVHHHRDGTRLVVASRWALQCDSAGVPVRVLTIDTDITGRKQAEDSLEHGRQEQMRFKDEFLSHVSHELRSPLTAIKQFTSILLGGAAGELNTAQYQYEEIVLKNIGQLQSMIDDLLQVTRLETGKLTIDQESTSVFDAVTDTLQTLRETARSKGVTLSSEVPADLPAAFADETRLRQILIILLDNAIKFTPSGGDVLIQARVTEDSRFLLVEVSDTGCGLSPEVVDRIFERLYQVPEPAQAGRKGLGLGLYICKELVTRQGGQISVALRPPQGCVFSFTLPVFSLARAMAPLLKNDKWPAESVALVQVDVSVADASASRDAREAWSREARSLLQACLLPDLDVLLPRRRSGVDGERFFVAAFADNRGASVLAKRITQQFDRLPQLQEAGGSLSVSYDMLQPLPPDAGLSPEHMLASMAASLEESIKAHTVVEAVHHG